LISLILPLALAGACNQRETRGSEAAAGEPAAAEAQATAKDLSPEDLGKLGAELKKNPDRAEQILTERGLDQQSFETAIRKVSEDPEASKRYAAAYKEASA
jgi:hypothetical protein